MDNQVYRIALAFPTAIPHLQHVLRGISRFGRERGWRFVISAEAPWLHLDSLQGWRGDGVIGWINTRDEADTAHRLAMPVVNLANVLPETSLPRVRIDHERAGEMAAQHLINRGFYRLAYYGLKDVWYSQLRERGFVRRAQRAGLDCAILRAPSSFDQTTLLHRSEEQLEHWLRELERPVGIMAVHDERARMVIEACARLNLRVPHEVAVIGMDNDETVCELCEPSLTSVTGVDEKVGLQAAVLLERLITGSGPTVQDVILPPERVVERGSTDISVGADPRIAAAIDFIRQNLDRPFGVEDVLTHVGVSRRWLEYRFRQDLDCTPHEFIMIRRIERAHELLATPQEIRISDVARSCGFRDVRRFRRVFRERTGTTPFEYRSFRRNNVDIDELSTRSTG